MGVIAGHRCTVVRAISITPTMTNDDPNSLDLRKTVPRGLVSDFGRCLLRSRMPYEGYIRYALVIHYSWFPCWPFMSWQKSRENPTIKDRCSSFSTRSQRPVNHCTDKPEDVIEVGLPVVQAQPVLPDIHVQHPVYSLTYRTVLTICTGFLDDCAPEILDSAMW